MRNLFDKYIKSIITTVCQNHSFQLTKHVAHITAPSPAEQRGEPQVKLQTHLLQD